jgi:HSP20 family protein
MATNRGTTGMARRPEEGYMPLSQAMSRLFQDSFLLPAFSSAYEGISPVSGSNLWETGDSFVVQVALPGMKVDSIQCSFEQHLLTVKGETALPIPDQARPVWQSFGGQTDFRLQIPGDVEAGAAEATYEAGVLTIRLPKVQHARARTINVTPK